ncbi:hypothetical protein FOL47_011204 [Perkinsus chesapeaki]|uniref:Uncharacterized protein n=1 Tax=Perkinsus chesapeaki TaxID=330153 RepID=A0A7J6MNF9_PERCH|nr:hypothetical protein FOL47_011204 [Perkinsus chesapeaki]
MCSKFIPTLKELISAADGKDDGWKNGLLTGWIKNPPMCLFGCCCHPCARGVVAAKTDDSFFLACCMNCCCPVCAHCSHNLPMRKAVREKDSIKGDIRVDCCAMEMCTCCAVTQELNQLGVKANKENFEAAKAGLGEEADKAKAEVAPKQENRRAQLLAAGRRLRATLTGLSRGAASSSTVDSSSIGAYSDEPSMALGQDIERYFTEGDSSTGRDSMQLDDITPDGLSSAAQGGYTCTPDSPPVSPPHRRVSVPRIPIAGLPVNHQGSPERSVSSSSVACQCYPTLEESTAELLRSELTTVMDQRLRRLEQSLTEQLASHVGRIEERLFGLEKAMRKLQPGAEMKPQVWRIVDIWQTSKHAS